MKKPQRTFIPICGLLLLAVFAFTASRVWKHETAPKTHQLRSQSTVPTSQEVSEENKQQVIANYGKLPMRFEANAGQLDEQVKFVTRGNGYSMFFTANEAVLSLQGAEGEELRAKSGGPRAERIVPSAELASDHQPINPLLHQSNDPSVHHSNAPSLQNSNNPSIQDHASTAVVRMKLVGANPNPVVSGQEELITKTNYLLGSDRSKWRTDVANYKKVHYHEAYPGIDLVYYGNQRQLEYDFVVSPGADPKLIQLQFEGLAGSREQPAMAVADNGDLVLQTAGGEIRQQKPMVYQEIGGERHELDGHYELQEANQVGFAVAGYDATRPLVIDPILFYSTYLGGGSFELYPAIAVDGSGNAYITGQTSSSDFPKVNALDGTVGGLSDAFVVKLDPTGSALVYATYLGGSDTESGRAIAVDGSGNAYVAGPTSSSDFPTVNAIDGTLGGQDAFVAKLNAAGSALVYATYLGGSDGDGGFAITVDGSGNAYLTGNTASSDFPTVNAMDGTLSGNSDAFVAKLNAAGSALVYATYLGGSGYELAPGIAVDGSGNVYVTGNTASSDFPTVNAIDGTLGGSYDAFVAKLNAAGSALVYSTYLGGSGYESETAIAMDGSGNVYVTGSTFSSDFPIVNAIDGTFNNPDAFVVKLNAAGSALVYSTYLGGSGFESETAIAVDGSGNAYVTGYTTSSDFPTVNAIDGTLGGYYDAFVAKLNAAGSALVYSTYLGGSDKENDPAIAVDGSGNAYLTGGTYSSDFPTVRAIDGTHGGWMGDVFVAKIQEKGPPVVTITAPLDGSASCVGSMITFTGSALDPEDGDISASLAWSSNLDGSLGSGASIYVALSLGTHTITAEAIDSGNLTASAQITMTVNVNPPASWSVAHIVDVDDVIFGINQSATTPLGATPRDVRGLALSPDERFLYLGYAAAPNRRLVRKIDLNVSDPADNHNSVVAQLQLPRGTQPARDIATDNKGRVYLALGTKIEIYNSNLQTPPLHTISGFTACEGVAARRETGKLVVYATDRLDKTLERFVLVEGTGETIASSNKTGLDGDGEVGIIGAASPRGLAVANNGTAWIADLSRGKVYRVNSAGNTVDSTGVGRPLDIAIDKTRGEAYVSMYTLRTIKVLRLSNGKSKGKLTPPAAGLNVDLDGVDDTSALSGIDVASCQRVFVANERGRSILTGNPPDSPFSNVGDNNDVKAADTDPVLLVTGNPLAKESEGEESEGEESEVVTSYELAQNYPNPFNPSTTINFAVPEAVQVSLKIYDVAGQLVQTSNNGVVEAGRHQVVWDGTNQHGVKVASGVYFYQLRAGEFKQVRKMSLVR